MGGHETLVLLNYTLLTTPEELLGTSLAPGEAIVSPQVSVKGSLGPYDLPGIVSIH